MTSSVDNGCKTSLTIIEANFDYVGAFLLEFMLFYLDNLAFIKLSGVQFVGFEIILMGIDLQLLVLLFHGHVDLEATFSPFVD